jgi:hypothetical protein
MTMKATRTVYENWIIIANKGRRRKAAKVHRCDLVLMTHRRPAPKCRKQKGLILPGQNYFDTQELSGRAHMDNKKLCQWCAELPHIADENRSIKTHLSHNQREDYNVQQYEDYYNARRASLK